MSEPSKPSRTSQLSPGLLDDPKNFELVNDHQFMVLSLGLLVMQQKLTNTKMGTGLGGRILP